MLLYGQGGTVRLRKFIGGTYKYQIDSKGRVRIPAKIKSLLGDNLWICVGDQENLVIYTEEMMDQLYDKYARMEVTDPEYVKHRYIFANMFQFVPDSQDRYQIPQILRDALGLKDEALFVGMVNKLEIWREDVYYETLARDNPTKSIYRPERK